ncbi:hypothetical protein SAMN05421819_2857 [Bryocella elongata]|uniref:SinR family protein n=1 Tax=Bryocella elongata TaxID=863522 RepID=A0A1H6A100_9BACT|nr:SinR family protein [Bryocella elongata]SEG42433.1 hypothetical protein SAMN05421819_2857 [Bryocella elongata]
MAVYVIGYDLDKPGQDYSSLIAEIKGLGSWWHCLDSTWIINTQLTATEVRDALKAKMDANDKLLVAAVGAPGAWSGFDKNCSDWLLKNLH